tara:strand:+ start:103 stop:1044 length:942 start_codon:yes stop_codon:yes gene_type:complete
MTFFDKKQDVLKIELTPYGRSLLSNGKLMPKYYAFFDDDIVYDIAAIGGTEEQNAIKNRIMNETPRLRPQRDLTSPENLIANFERGESSSRPFSQVQLNYLTEPLGTSDGTERNASSWHLTTILGEIDSTESTYDVSGSYLRQIPQINMTVEYTMQVRNVRDDSPVRGQASSPSVPVTDVFDDGTYLEIIDEQIITRIIEENGFTFKEGLEIEAFIYEDEEKLIPLKMSPQTKGIVNDMLVDSDDRFIQIDHTYLEFWLSIFFDEDIPDSDLCKGISRLKKEDILLDIDVECPDEQGIDFDIYRTRVTDVERC